MSKAPRINTLEDARAHLATLGWRFESIIRTNMDGSTAWEAWWVLDGDNNVKGEGSTWQWAFTEATGILTF